MALDLKITASLNDNMSLGLNLITSALGKNKKAAELAKKGLLGLSSSATAALNSLSGLVSAFKSGNILLFGQGIIGASTSLGGLTTALGTATGAAGGLGAAMTAALGPIGLIVGAIAAVGAVGFTAAKSAADLDKHLDSLQALTGLDDSSMKDMSKSAIQMSKDFGTAAADVVDSMKLIGSQAPELLKDQEGLKGVTEAANVLAKAGEIEVVDAAKAITGTMNQMGASAAEASNIINVLAAGAKEGSYEISQLNEVFGKAGTMAKSSGMNYTELAALVEAVGGKFEEASVLGTSLNSTLIALSVQGNDKFKPAVVGMLQAIENMAAAELSDLEMKDLVGASNVKLLKSMIEMKGEYERLLGAITGTSAAYDMAAKNTDNMEGTIAKLKASWDAFMITLGETSFILGAIGLLLALMDGITSIINQVSNFIEKLGELGGTSPIIEALKNPFFQLTAAIKILGEAISFVVALATKILEGFQAFILLFVNGVKARMKDWGIWEPFVKGVKWMYDKVIGIFNAIKQAYNELKKWLGMDVKEINKTGDNIDITKPNQGNTKSDGKTYTTDKNKPKVKVKVEAEPGSLDALKEKLTKLQKTLTSKKLSLVDIEKTNNEIDILKKQIEDKEIELGIKPKKGVLEKIKDEIDKLDKQIYQLDPRIDKAQILDLLIKKGELEETKREIEEGFKPIEVTVVRKSIRNIDKIDPKTISLPEAEEALSQLNSDLRKETDRTSENYLNLIDRIKKWTAVKEQKEIEINADLSNAAKGSMKWLSEQKAYWQGKLDLSVYGTPEYNEAMQHINELTKQENKIKLQMEIDGMSDFEKVYTFMDGFHAIDGVVGSFESLSKAIDENANAWEVFMGILLAFESIMAAVNAVTDISNLLSGIAAGVKTAEAGANIAASTAEKKKMATDAAAIAPTTAATAANKALESSFLDLAAAEIFAAHASIPFAGVGIASGFITTMLSAQAATKAATKAMMAFETGGIIGGNSYHGDKLIARVNSGEMILNGRLLRNLFDAINENRLGGENSNRLYGEVKVKGQDLYIALSNFGKVKSTLGKHIGIH